MTTATTNKPTEAEIKAHQDRLQAAIDTLNEGLKKNTKDEMIIALQLVEEEFKGERDVLGPAKHGNVELVRNRVEQLLGILKSDVGEMSAEEIRPIVESVRDHLTEVLKMGSEQLTTEEEEVEPVNESIDVVIFNADFSIPSDDAGKTLKVLDEIGKKMEQAKVKQADIDGLEQLKTLLAEDYPDDNTIELAISTLIDQAKNKIESASSAEKDKEEIKSLIEKHKGASKISKIKVPQLPWIDYKSLAFIDLENVKAIVLKYKTLLESPNLKPEDKNEYKANCDAYVQAREKDESKSTAVISQTNDLLSPLTIEGIRKMKEEELKKSLTKIHTVRRDLRKLPLTDPSISLLDQLETIEQEINSILSLLDVRDFIKSLSVKKIREMKEAELKDLRGKIHETTENVRKKPSTDISIDLITTLEEYDLEIDGCLKLIKGREFLSSLAGKKIEEMKEAELKDLKTKVEGVFQGLLEEHIKLSAELLDELEAYKLKIDERLKSLSVISTSPATKKQPAVKPGPKAVPDIKLHSSKEAYEAVKESPEFKRLIEIISFIKKSGEHFTKGDGQKEFYEKQKTILDCKGDFSRAVLDDIRSKFYNLARGSKNLQYLTSIKPPQNDDEKSNILRLVCGDPRSGSVLTKKDVERRIEKSLKEFDTIISEAKKYAEGKDKDSIKSFLVSVDKKEIDKLKEDELKELKDEIENATGGRRGTPEEMRLNMFFNAIDKRLTAIKNLKALNLNDKDIEKMDADQLMALQIKIDELKAVLTSSDIRQFKNHINLVGNRLVALGVLTAPKIQAPADMPNEFKGAYEIVATVITDQDKLDKFLNACNIVMQDVRPAFLSANEFVQLKNKLSILKNTSIDDEKREMIKEEAEDIISLVSKASPSEIQDLSETINIKALLKKITRRDAKLREKIDEMFEILDFDTSTITSDDDREDVQKLQEDIRILLNQEIPDEFFNERTLEKTAKKLSGLRLEDQRREFEKICGGISKKIEYLDRYIAEYRTIKADKKATGSPAVEPPIPLTQPAVGAAAGAAPTQTEKTEEEKKSEKEKTKKETKEKADTELDKKIQELMGEILIDKSLYSVDGKAKDPASLAVRKIIINDIKAENLPVLIAFLKKPNIAIDPKISEILEEFKNPDKLKAELAKQEWDLQVAKDQLADARARKNVHGVSESEKEKIDEDIKNTLYPAVRKLDDIVKKIKTAMDMKNGTVRYQSTTQLLMMINVFIANRDDKKPSEIDLVKDVESQVDAQREESYGKSRLYHKLFNSLGGVIKPSLTTTLQTLEKDEYLKPIGKEKLTLLAKGWNNRGNVDAWINNLSGSEEEKMTKIVPRVIAYLEIAIRNGNMAYLNIASMGRAEGLLKNLKAARHEYVMKKVERYAQGKNLSDIDKMSAYFLELNEATVSEKKISHEIIRNAALKTMGKYGGIGAVLGAGGIGLAIGGAAIALGAPALIGAGALTKSFSAEKPETKAALRRGAIRGIVASALALGSIPLTGGVGLAVIPALFGTFSPELWKYRKQIGRGTKKTAAWTAPKAWWMTKLGLKLGVVAGTGGLILFNKSIRQAMFGSKKTS